MLLMAVVVGLGAGFGAVGFRELIALFTWIFFTVIGGHISNGGRLYLLVIPALGALLFWPIIRYFAPEARGHGVPEVMEAVSLRGGRMRPQVVVAKALASAINIGSGGSVGREGPIVQIGSALGSTVGQRLKMSDDRIRTLVAAGAAAGIAATFNAPFAGAFFALEVILDEFSIRNFSTVVVAAVIADVIGRAFFGVNASFAVPAEVWNAPIQLPLYCLLGCMAGVLGVVFTRTLYATEDLFERLPLPSLAKPVSGGLSLGALAIVVPRGYNSLTSAILGVGYPTMTAALYGRIALGLLLLFLVAKIIAVSLTIGSGGSGGVFGPSLFIGSMLGAAFGETAHLIAPSLASNAMNGFVIAGMAAVFAGAAQAPITSIMILFEMTTDYKTIIPLMLTVVIATVVSKAISSQNIYTLKLSRRGIDINEGRERNVMKRIRVADAMTPEVDCVPAEMSVKDLVSLMRQTHKMGYPVIADDGNFAGMVRAEDVEDAMLNDSSHTVADIVEHVPTAFGDETLEEAVERFGLQDQRRVPVVDRGRPNRLIGVLHAWDVVNAYRAEIIGKTPTNTELPGWKGERGGKPKTYLEPTDAGSRLEDPLGNGSFHEEATGGQKENSLTHNAAKGDKRVEEQEVP
jgi:CIC family chloride channel protein